MANHRQRRFSRLDRVNAGERRLADILVGYLDLEDTSIPEVVEEAELPLVADESPKVAEIDLDSEEVAEGATEEEDEVEAGLILKSRVNALPSLLNNIKPPSPS